MTGSFGITEQGPGLNSLVSGHGVRLTFTRPTRPTRPTLNRIDVRRIGLISVAYKSMTSQSVRVSGHRVRLSGRCPLTPRALVSGSNPGGTEGRERPLQPQNLRKNVYVCARVTRVYGGFSCSPVHQKLFSLESGGRTGLSCPSVPPGLGPVISPRRNWPYALSLYEPLQVLSSQP